MVAQQYDPHGGKQPLPPGITNAAELLEAEMGDIVCHAHAHEHAQRVYDPTAIYPSPPSLRFPTTML